MANQIQLGDTKVEVVLKSIKNIHLSVHPPTGRITISAPSHMSLDTIRVFAISKLDWIRRQQRKLLEQERETPREFLERESHYVWGKRYLLKIVERDAPPCIELLPNQLKLSVRPGSNSITKEALIEKWYRDELRSVIPPLIGKWEKTIGIIPSRFFIQKMKTKWEVATTSRKL